MPIYEYVCEKCGQSMEAIQRLADPPLEECPKCGGRLRKKVSAPAFQFKGTGWYVTDYARKGESGRSGSSSSESSSGGDDSSASSAKKTETKTGTKTETATKSSD